MFKWVLIFFVAAVIMAIFGFGGIASSLAGIAQILFWIALVVFLITAVLAIAGKRSGPIT
jgi:uncharacterized membrane protein YtjA (UPF0391 family)